MTPCMMGIVNVTPDSFSDGGLHASLSSAVGHAERLIGEGAQIVDIGGESTRPGARELDVGCEMERVLPVIAHLARRGLPARISIDTRHHEVASAAIEHGADIVNDVSGLADESMVRVVADAKATVVIMHMQKSPETMQVCPYYDDVVADVHALLRARAMRARRAGIASTRIWVDPGLGFGKTTRHNLILLRHMSRLRQLGYPVVVGPSRKAFLGSVTGRTDAAARDAATAAACTAAIILGADVVRVHDVRAVRDAVRVATAVRSCA